DQSATENTSEVKLAKKFKDGKEGNAEVLFAETLTSLARGTDNANNKLIAYNYVDETGKISATQITVSSDVINNFEEILKDESVKKELNKFITQATGSVVVSKDATTGNITIS
ncbi:hypothetical protein, partial [Myroides albus]